MWQLLNKMNSERESRKDFRPGGFITESVPDGEGFASGFSYDDVEKWIDKIGRIYYNSYFINGQVINATDPVQAFHKAYGYQNTRLMHKLYIKKHPRGFAVTKGTLQEIYLLEIGPLYDMAQENYAKIRFGSNIPYMEVYSNILSMLPTSGTVICDLFDCSWQNVDEAYIKRYRDEKEAALKKADQERTWYTFSALFPRSPEVIGGPVYTNANFNRWKYHIEEARKNQGFEKVNLDLASIEGLRAANAVSVFEEFSKEQQKAYKEIAKCFPGIQVYACGSQVRGDYMRDYNFSYIIEARQKAGMRVDRVSDYDFWVHPHIENSWASPLPPGADRFRGKFNPNTMIPIPIYEQPV